MSVEAVSPSTVETDLERLKIEEKPDVGVNRSSESSTQKSMEARKLPFSAPASSATKQKPHQLTTEEQSKYDDVLQHMKSLESLPVSSNKKNKETAPLSEVEQYFLSRECILRYLRATRWNVAEAKKRLEGTIVWRREYGTDTLTAEQIEPEVSHQRQNKLM